MQIIMTNNISIDSTGDNLNHNFVLKDNNTDDINI